MAEKLRVNELAVVVASVVGVLVAAVVVVVVAAGLLLPQPAAIRPPRARMAAIA
jgi:hypothetical protein